MDAGSIGKVTCLACRTDQPTGPAGKNDSLTRADKLIGYYKLTITVASNNSSRDENPFLDTKTRAKNSSKQPKTDQKWTTNPVEPGQRRSWIVLEASSEAQATRGDTGNRFIFAPLCILNYKNFIFRQNTVKFVLTITFDHRRFRPSRSKIYPLKRVVRIFSAPQK